MTAGALAFIGNNAEVAVNNYFAGFSQLIDAIEPCLLSVQQLLIYSAFASTLHIKNESTIVNGNKLFQGHYLIYNIACILIGYRVIRIYYKVTLTTLRHCGHDR